MHTTEDIQRKLLDLGYDLGPGGADGILGSYTRKAIIAFQATKKIPTIYPGTVGPKTLAELFGQPEGEEKTTRPWLELALRKKGLHEDRDYAELSKFLKSDGKTLGDPRKLPWCGDFVSSCIALTLPHEGQPENPYLARNWLKFGRPTEPTIGAVAVFWRGTKKGLSGHVAFHYGEDDTAYHVLGGNQGNSINVTRIAKSRLLGSRWPVSSPQGKTQLAKLKDNGSFSIDEA